jgi:hypothetical protein
MCDDVESVSEQKSVQVCEQRSSEIVNESVNAVLTRLRMNELPRRAIVVAPSQWSIDRPWVNSNLRGGLRKKGIDLLLENVFVCNPKNVLIEFRKIYESIHARTGVSEIEYIWRMIIECNNANLRKMARQPRTSSDTLDVKQICERLKVINSAATVRKRVDDIKSSEDGVECLVCYESYHTVDMIVCRSTKRLKHFICVKCFHEYVTNTRNLNDCLSTIPCVDQECVSVYGVDRVESLLSIDMVERLRVNESTLNNNVALRAAVRCVIRCSCGVVGVVEVDDVVEDDVVACTCGLTYCVKCSNRYHGSEIACLPNMSNDVLHSVATSVDAKACPNCGVGIQHDGGCMHMTCSVLGGGCGHEFCWTCLGEWPRCRCIIDREVGNAAFVNEEEDVADDTEEEDVEDDNED